MITVALLPETWMDRRRNSAVLVVLDVLRATSTIVTGLSAGAREVQLFGSLEAARDARQSWPPGAGPVLLAGEANCLKPPDFDLGNSPREQVTEKVGNAPITTGDDQRNAPPCTPKAAGAGRLFAGSLLNASATARALLPHVDAMDTVLLCAGTGGKIAAGGCHRGRSNSVWPYAGKLSHGPGLHRHRVDGLSHIRRRSAAATLRFAWDGGINVVKAGLEDDIDHCARLDALPMVAPIEMRGDDLVVRKADIKTTSRVSLR